MALSSDVAKGLPIAPVQFFVISHMQRTQAKFLPVAVPFFFLRRGFCPLADFGPPESLGEKSLGDNAVSSEEKNVLELIFVSGCSWPCSYVSIGFPFCSTASSH